MGVDVEQSVSVRQATQSPSGLQSFPGCVAQLALAVHCTQLDTLVLQNGVEPVHCTLEVQPARQAKLFGSQIGLATP
ncbi:MAG: hypothetical protein ACREJ3_02905, partial [Polyangiaceae bacterium]